MNHFRGAFATLALAASVAGATAGVCAAQPWAQHFVGEDCIGADIGRQDVAPNGQPIICDSDYRWEPYVGQNPSDPWVDAQHP
jgi:hypothetical protein